MNHPNLTSWLDLAGMLTSKEYAGKRIIVCSAIHYVRRLQFEKAAAEGHDRRFRLHNEAEVLLVRTTDGAIAVAGTQPDLVILDGIPNGPLFDELRVRIVCRCGEVVTLQASLQHYSPVREPA